MVLFVVKMARVEFIFILIKIFTANKQIYLMSRNIKPRKVYEL